LARFVQTAESVPKQAPAVDVRAGGWGDKRKTTPQLAERLPEITPPHFKKTK